jgi:hypothetical protein
MEVDTLCRSGLRQSFCECWREHDDFFIPERTGSVRLTAEQAMDHVPLFPCPDASE